MDSAGSPTPDKTAPRPDTVILSAESYYGKSFVKLLHLRRYSHGTGGRRHEIRELEVSVYIWTDSKRNILKGDNADIITTDSMKNMVYILAKLYGVKSPESFGQVLCRHFLSTYCHVTSVRVNMEEAPWRRLSRDGQDHIHAFIWSRECIRLCEVTHKKGEKPVVRAGLKNLKLMKTTQSGFVGFIRDEYTTLLEATDRLLATSFNAMWSYETLRGLDEDGAWKAAVDGIILAFAGPVTTGVYSTSTTQTLQTVAQKILQLIPQVSKVEMEMPNLHYSAADLTKFGINNSEVLIPNDKPHGLIRLALGRAPPSKL